MNFDTIIGSVFPGWALKRAKARQQLRLYDAAQSSQYHKPLRGAGYSGNAVMQNAGAKLRERCRYLDENHDLAIGVLNALVDNIVGTGITLEPMARFSSGERQLSDRLNAQLKQLWTDFWRRPEASGQIPGHEVERLVCRTWLRDGEILVRHLPGDVPGLEHLHQVDYSLELIEADYLPFMPINNLGDVSGKVVHGVEIGAFKRPLNYHLYTSHPGDIGLERDFNLSTIAIPADQIIHLKHTKRLNQVRGAPILHGVIQRLSDLFDYEESERIAARVAASFTGAITKSLDTDNTTTESNGARTMEMRAGMIWDGLLPGESIETIGSDRPNTGVESFRNGQLRAASAGAGANYSTVSRDYSGSYSSQRQEMVEGRIGYQRMTAFYTAVFMQPVWAKFIDMCETQRLIRIPANIDRDSVMMPSMRGPITPWIDPDKESKADERALKNRFKSRQQIIRERNGDPVQVDAEIEADPLLDSIDEAEPEPKAEPDTEPDETDEDEEQDAA